jgi:two-component system, response regulator YesN
LSYNILLVDDDKDFRKEFIEYFYDYSIIEANNGLEALSLLNEINIIDLAILDVRMPGIKGTQVLSEIKKIKPDLYTIILTAYSSEDTAIEALKAHADDYMEKPVNFVKFKEIIDNVIVKNKYHDDLDVNDIQEKIDKIKLYIEKNYDKVFNLNDISKIVFLSPKYLSKLFKSETGVNFNEYKLNIKIKYAIELLNNTGNNIEQIAYKLGYKKPESFIKIFKKITKLTPTEFRNQIKNITKMEK